MNIDRTSDQVTQARQAAVMAAKDRRTIVNINVPRVATRYAMVRTPRRLSDNDCHILRLTWHVFSGTESQSVRDCMTLVATAAECEPDDADAIVSALCDAFNVSDKD